MSTSPELQKQLRHARPSLKLVSPHAHAIVLIFGLFNIFLGLSLILAIDQDRITAPLIIVNEVFNFRFWGIVFIALGAIKLVSLKFNSWSLSRRSLLLGMAIKSAWALALLVRSTTHSGTWLITIMWVTLAAIQIAIFIYFMPSSAAYL